MSLWMGFKWKEDLRVHRKLVFNFSCNYYWWGGKKLPANTVQTGLKSLIITGNVNVTPPTLEKKIYSEWGFSGKCFHWISTKFNLMMALEQKAGDHPRYYNTSSLRAQSSRPSNLATYMPCSQQGQTVHYSLTVFSDTLVCYTVIMPKN